MWGDIIATVGIWKVKSNLKKVINYIDDENKIDSDIFDDLHNELEYITNDDKTEKNLYYVNTTNLIGLLGILGL